MKNTIFNASAGKTLLRFLKNHAHFYAHCMHTACIVCMKVCVILISADSETSGKSIACILGNEVCMHYACKCACKCA